MLRPPSGLLLGTCLVRRALRRVQHVADTANGIDHLRRKAVVNLAAKMPNIDVNDVRQAVIIHVPYMLDNHSTAERPAAIAHHVLEDAELLWRQFDILIGARDLTADTVQLQIAHLQALRRGLPAAQKGADSREQFNEGEGLDEVVIRPKLEP